MCQVMKRDIKFRAKRLDNGEWVYGLLWKKHFNSRESFISCFPDKDDNETAFRIDPLTLGQYTGLKDKNDKEVYQGDIVNCTSGCPHEIIWIEAYGGTFFGGMLIWYLSGLKEGYAWSNDEEIIGNIHDNSDLLTEG